MSVCPKCGTSYAAKVRLCPVDGAVLPDGNLPDDPRLGTVLAGKYRLDSKLGRGGMGTIYRATHVMLGKPVAVKLINTNLETTAEFVQRFQREARAASGLDHPNIATVHDLGQVDDGTLYIAMELIEGRSLKDIIRVEGSLAPARIGHLLGQVGSALAVAHRHNVIHRDLKPQNIMVATDAQGREMAKLLDFGIAKTFDDDATQLTATGLALGTPQYMAPEQAAGKVVDPRSDLYALGIILYEMIVGQVPFDDPSTPAVLVKHMTEPPPRPSARRPDLAVSAELEAIVMRCLEKEPAARFQSAEDFVVALAAASGIPAIAVAPVVAPGSAAPTRVEPAPTVVAEMSSTGPTAPVLPPVSAPPPSPAPVAEVKPLAAMPPPLAMRNLTTASATGTPAAEGAAARRSSGSAMVLAALVLVLVGGVGSAAYFLGYFSNGPALEPVNDAELADPNLPTGDEPATDQPADPAETAGPGLTLPDAGQPDASPIAATPRDTPMARAGDGADRSLQPQAPRPATPTPTPADVTPPIQEQTPPLPANPTVYFGCDGSQQVCGELRAALAQALSRDSMRVTGSQDSADVFVDAFVTASPPRTETSFGTTFTVRSFSVTLTGTDRRDSEDVAMPAPASFSFDDRVGRARLTEQSRLIAGGAATRVRAFWTRKIGG